MELLNQKIQNCNQCKRLRSHCQEIARVKRKAFANETYWGKPVSGFGDTQAQLLIVGLAPAAHGANRTGRMFTGDRSGEWLYRALHQHGFANQAHSVNVNDGLKLKNAYITSVVKCAPPDNKPTPEEKDNCIPYLQRELAKLKNVTTYLALGKFALDGLWECLDLKLTKPKFKHGVHIELPNNKNLILSFHPSQQNTFTGKLTKPMFDRVFELAKQSF